MQTTNHTNLTFEQIRSLVRQLPEEEKIILTNELIAEDYISPSPCCFTRDELQNEVSEALSEYKNDEGCSHDDMLDKYTSK